MTDHSDMAFGGYPVLSVDLYPDRHEAVVDCAGKHRITIVACEQLGITEGMTLTEDEFERLVHAEQWLACIQKALSHLDYGDCSKRRLSEKLKRFFEPEMVAEVVDYLAEKGYLNDLGLAERYAGNYYDVRNYGPMRIRKELFGKGFDGEVVSKVTERYFKMDHTEKVVELIRKKYADADFKDPAAARKASAWLYSLGYSWSDISQVLDSFR
ncbi:MAG: RecX family transcriptional regulator [Clostridia bacterium]|nr:RecX family transcriptional regulator [Clostridia bacterium]